MTDVGPDSHTLCAADLFCGLSAIVITLFTVMALPPSVVERALGKPTETRGLDRLGNVIVVSSFGLELLSTGRTAERIPLADIPVSDAFRDWLALSADPLVVLKPDAEDAAFLLEPALASAGLGPVRRIRLPEGCSGLLVQGDSLLCTR